MNEMDVSSTRCRPTPTRLAPVRAGGQGRRARADAITRTIHEINRIKETSADAVAAIVSLGRRIDAIGDILNVIDDVAEQTNLLALNAAIIAAQAGEYGKASPSSRTRSRAGGALRHLDQGDRGADPHHSGRDQERHSGCGARRHHGRPRRGREREAEQALKKILDSSQKSTAMSAPSRAHRGAAKGSKQVTDAISRIAETVQQIAAATAEQARGPS